jgi:hypothetical protein
LFFISTFFRAAQEEEEEEEDFRAAFIVTHARIGQVSSFSFLCFTTFAAATLSLSSSCSGLFFLPFLYTIHRPVLSMNFYVKKKTGGKQQKKKKNKVEKKKNKKDRKLL